MQTDETEGDGVQQSKHDEQLHPNPTSSNSSSSPSQEFSFATSQLHPPPFAAVDLSPADEIFFHGHLLPLHFLSHLPASPRSSSGNSMDSFTLPATELFSSENNDGGRTATADERSLLEGGKAGAKSKSFSLFFGLPKRRNGRERGEGQKGKSASKLDHVGRFVAKYVRLIRPLVTALRNGRENREEVEIRRRRRQSDCGSFSANFESRNRLKLSSDRKEFSAPASTRNSPTNSGLLISTGKLSSTSDQSTMEELQAAIQAAIAHCKNSVDSGEDKNKRLS